VDDALQDTIDHVAIQRLQSTYADIVSRKACAELDEVFRPDATVVINRRTGEPLTLQGSQAIGDFIARMIDGLDFFEFVVLNARVYLRHEGDPDRAVARVYMSELRRDRDSERWNVVYGIYHDRYERVDGRWWMAQRHYHSLARTNADLDVFPFPTESFGSLADPRGG
jgi:hypothetical protein